MAGTKTNSNSMTAILIVALNNKKSGFRTEFFRTIGLEDDGSVFYDGTHSSVEYPEIDGKQVDIVGRLNGQLTLLMEVKVGTDEDLQPSQADSGQYKEVYDAHKDKIKRLIYLIPDNYSHEKKLPKVSDGIKIIKWSEILQKAKEFDSYGLDSYIEQFVDLPLTTSVLLEKGEIYMLLNQKAYVTARSLGDKILELSRTFAETSEDGKRIIKTKEQDDNCGVGCYYSLKKNNKDGNIFIGLNPNIDDEYYFFALAVDKKYKTETKNNEKGHDANDGYIYYSFLDDENYEEFEKLALAENKKEQQDAFNKMVSNTMKRAGLI